MAQHYSCRADLIPRRSSSSESASPGPIGRGSFRRWRWLARPESESRTSDLWTTRALRDLLAWLRLLQAGSHDQSNVRRHSELASRHQFIALVVFPLRGRDRIELAEERGGI